MRKLFVFGLPVAAAVATYAVTASILFAALALVGAFVIVVVIAAKLASSHPAMQPGTRAWKAMHTAQLLRSTIGSRTNELHATADPQRRGQLERELAFLSTQYDEQRAIVTARDASPTTGPIRFEPYRGA